MSTASTSFPSYASQVVCQGFNLRKCIKNIYKAGKACVFPFFKSRTRKKVIWDVSCEVMPLPIFNTKQLFLFSFGQVGNVQGPHNSPQAYCGLLASPTFSNLHLAERKWKQLLRRLTWNANENTSASETSQPLLVGRFATQKARSARFITFLLVFTHEVNLWQV